MKRAILSFLFLAASASTAMASDCAALFTKAFARDAVASRFLSYVPFAPVTIGGQGPYWFLLDTGANRSAIDSALARDLGLKVLGAQTVEGSAGTIQTGSVRVPALKIGKVSARNVEPTTQDFSGLVGPDGAKVSGILGSDVMRAFVVMLDFKGERIALRKPGGEAALARCGRVLPFQLDNGMVLYDARIDGAPVKLRHDSGAGLFKTDEAYVNVTEDQHRPLAAATPDARPVATLGGSGVGGSVKLPVYRAGSLEIGAFRREAPKLIVQPKQGYFARPDAVGFVGDYVFWPEGGMIFDYPGRRVILPAARRP